MSLVRLCISKLLIITSLSANTTIWYTLSMNQVRELSCCDSWEWNHISTAPVSSKFTFPSHARWCISECCSVCLVNIISQVLGFTVKSGIKFGINLSYSMVFFSFRGGTGLLRIAYWVTSCYPRVNLSWSILFFPPVSQHTVMKQKRKTT